MYVFSVASRRGFTLIELLIVPGVIGLIVGGMLAGQSQIKSRAIRAQISQDGYLLDSGDHNLWGFRRWKIIREIFWSWSAAFRPRRLAGRICFNSAGQKDSAAHADRKSTRLNSSHL